MFLQTFAVLNIRAFKYQGFRQSHNIVMLHFLQSFLILKHYQFTQRWTLLRFIIFMVHL